jgi:hypothetical protein
MTRDEITRMASMAGFETKGGMVWVDQWEVTRTMERFAALVAAAEREAIHDEWSTRLQGDLEHGVKWMNEVAAENWRGSFRGMSGFSEWLTQRGEK